MHRRSALILALVGCIDLERPSSLNEQGTTPPSSLDAAVLALQPNGAACGEATRCVSGFCVDGVCCESACRDRCHTCSALPSVGICAPVGVGEDPRADCAKGDEATCGLDGTCDGAGACRFHAAGTECGAPTCAAGVESALRTCNGMGVCRAAATKPCAPFACGGATCRTACTAPADCASGSSCQDGRCTGLLAAGMRCTAPGQCLSGFCADEVCCGSACGEPCRACNLPGSLGICAFVPAGQDPTNDCNGQTSCANGVLGLPRRCDGNGACQAPMTRRCAPYACAGNACATSCTTQGQCSEGFACAGGTCQQVNGSGLVGYWRFDDGMGTMASDSSGNRNHGTVIGATGNEWRPNGKVGGSLALNGTSHWVRVLQSPTLDSVSGPLTIVGWVFRNNASSAFLAHRQHLTTVYEHYGLWMRADNTFRVLLNNQVQNIGLCDSAPPTLPVGRWVHLAVTYDGASARIYLDGQNVCTEARSTTFSNYQRPLMLGAQIEGSDVNVTKDRLNGQLDEVMLWSRALSAAEIQQLHAGARPAAR